MALRRKQPSPETTHYDYTENFRIVRTDFSDGTKKPWPQTRVNGKWINKAPKKPYPIFDAASLGDAETVYVLEGAKCAVLARKLGLSATTSAFGTGGAPHTDWSPIAHRRKIVVLPDEDEPGLEHAQKVAKEIHRINPGADIRILRLPGLGPAEDIEQFIERSRSKSDEQIRQEIEALVRRAKRWRPSKKGSRKTPGQRRSSRTRGRNVTLTSHAGGLRRQGYGYEAIVDELLALNDSEFDVPLPETELVAIARSVCRYPVGDACVEYQPFPVDALPPRLRDMAVELAKAMGCDVGFTGPPLLVIFAALIGNTACIEIKKGWREPAVLWLVLIAVSGSKKTPALRALLEPIREIEAANRQRFLDELERYKRDLKAYKSGTDSKREPEMPSLLRLICSDITVEALAVLLRDNPLGLLIDRDELAGLIGGFDRYSRASGGDANALLEMHGAGTLSNDRKTGEDPSIFVKRAAVSMLGGTQPETFDRMFMRQHADNGLVPRLLISRPPTGVSRWTDAEVPDSVLKKYADLIRKLNAKREFRHSKGLFDPDTLRFTESGRRRFIDFYNDWGRHRQGMKGYLAAAYSKLEGGCGRIALVLHLVRVASGDNSVEEPKAVDGASVDAAVTLIKWFGNEAYRVAANAAESEASRRETKVEAMIRELGGAATADELRRKSRAFPNSEEAEKAMAALVHMGVAAWRLRPPGRDGGRPTDEVYLLDTGVAPATPCATPIAHVWRAALKRLHERAA